MIAPARTAAFDILRAMRKGGTDLPAAIARSRSELRDDRDRALAADIATGVQRHRGTLDFLVQHFARRPLDRLDVEVVDVLRLSIYQLLHLTRVPAAAVVDDAVTLTRRAKKTSAAGFVNAVLRAVSRTRSALPLPQRPDANAGRERVLEYLTVVGSHPRWLVERWLDRLGFDRTEAWTAFNNQPAPLTLRANTLTTTTKALVEALARRGIAAHAAAYAPDALIVDEGAPLSDRDLDPQLFLVQDEASQLVALLAGEQPGPRVLDTCAAPGGKTAALAAAVGARGMVVAADVRDRRVRLLRRTMDTAHATRVQIVRADAAAPLPFAAMFSTVLVDAPCSGLGTLRRDPDIRWRRTAGDLAPLAATQLAMLRQAAAVVAPGGRLIYATCSTEPEENEEVASAFLAAADFVPVDARGVHRLLPAVVVDDRGHLRTCPDRHGLEGFFGAVFARRPA